MNAASFAVPPDFRLADSVAFLEGFTPQPVESSPRNEAVLRFATPLAPGWAPTEVVLTEHADQLSVEWDSDIEANTVRSHVERILSLDIDASGFADVVDADEVLAEVIDPRRGIRPPLFWSPYEAAVWAILSQRIHMTQASTLKRRLANELGTPSASGSTVSTPTPEVLAELEAFEGLNDTKIERLRAVAHAAIDGTLDPQQLRAAPTDDALGSLQRIDGIGAFSAELILVRGAGAPDVFPSNEKRLEGIMRQLYGASTSTRGLREVADGWRPYRSWVAFHLRSYAQRRT